MIGKMLGSYQITNRPGEGCYRRGYSGRRPEAGPLRSMKFLPLLVAILLSPATTIASSCESLTGISLPGTTVTSAQMVAAGNFIPPQGVPGAMPAALDAGQAYKTLPAFCRVAATIKPTDDSDIKIEVWMPASGWNGKFLGVGGGGFAGVISYGAMGAALQRGICDGLHRYRAFRRRRGLCARTPEVRSILPSDPSAELTLKAKTIIRAFFWRRFLGCSYWEQFVD